MGDPPFQYRWTRITNGVNNAFPAGIITTNNVLHINNVLVSDGGNYTCTVTNDVGSSSSAIPVYSMLNIVLYFSKYLIMCLYNYQQIFY